LDFRTSLTSSSLNGLRTATISFIVCAPFVLLVRA
jgi:hypothetical protein